MRRTEVAVVRALAALAVLLLAAAGALADDYLVMTATGRYEAPPQGAAGTGVTSSVSTKVIPTPFPVLYYGVAYETVTVNRNGCLRFGPLGNHNNSDNQPFPQGAADDGVCAVAWERCQDGSNLQWVTGTGDDRRWIICWKNVSIGYGSINKLVSFEVILYERTGRIVFAYDTSSTGWNNLETYGVGLDSPGDSRWIAPRGNDPYVFSGMPPNDIILDPALVRVTGTALYDRLVSGASGTGASVESGVAVPSTRIELRSGTVLRGLAWTDEDGAFDLRAAALPASQSGKVVLVADNAACTVGAAAGGPSAAVDLTSTFSLASDSDLGDLTLGSSADPTGASRAALDVAATVGRLRTWCAARLPSAPPRLTVLYSASSTDGTAYTKALGPTAAFLRVSGAASGNEDGFDRAMIARAYGRHVLASIAAAPDAQVAVWDQTSVADNAFAEAFGYALWAGAYDCPASFVEGYHPTQAAVRAIETPQASSPPADTIVARLAGALYDLVDGPNEAHDEVDGDASAVPLDAAGRLLSVVDSMTAAPTAATFLNAWIAAGHDPVPLVRAWIGNGIWADDADEPNDRAGEAARFASLGTLRTDRALVPHNDDWFEFDVAEPLPALHADVSFDRTKLATDLTLEVRAADGSLAGSATTAPGFGPVRCTTGAVPAGTYRLRVVHGGGPLIDRYAVQAFRTLRILDDELPEWTAGRPYDAPVPVQGGVGTRLLALTPGNVLPPGLGLAGATHRIVGTPSQPGTWTVQLEATDSGSPSNRFAASKTLRVHPPLTLGLGPVAAFALGRMPLVTGLGKGGTDPVVTTLASGRLPDGLSIAQGRLVFAGAPEVEESARFRMEGVDAAGSADAADVLGVVCVATVKGRAKCALAEGDAGCGFWFDALAGSKVNVSFATAKKRAKRALAGSVLGPDGTTAVSGGKRKTASGSFRATGVVVPASGRCFAAVASASGAATAFDGSVAVALPKSGRVTSAVLPVNATVPVEIGALSGAKFTLTAAPAKRGQASVVVKRLYDPSGRSVATAGATKELKGGGVSLTYIAPTAGTWRVELEVRGVDAAVKASWTVKQPKGAVYSAD